MKRNTRKRFLDIGKALGIGLIGWSAITLASYMGNRVNNVLFPSQIRQEFRQEFGFPLYGWKEDIEESGERVTRIAAALNRERLQRPFELESFRICSDNFFKQNPYDQFETLFGDNPGAYYFCKRVVARPENEERAVRHEIAHGRIYDLEEKNPDFKRRWTAFAKDEDGNSLYNGAVKYVLFRLKGARNIVSPKEGKKDEKAIKQGFLHDYARSNYHEDVAECAESSGSYTTKKDGKALLANGRVRNVFTGKIDLGEANGVLPKGYGDYLELHDLLVKSRGGGGWKLRDESEGLEYLKESEGFLLRNKGSVFDIDVRYARGWMHQQFAKKVKGDEKTSHLEQAIEEFRAALDCEFKAISAYSVSLARLASCHGKLGETKEKSALDKAKEEYKRRFEKGDVRLSIDGVNKELESLGYAL